MWLPLMSSSAAGYGGGDHARHGRPLEPGAGLLAMWLFLASLAALFAPLLVVLLILRFELGGWPPPGMPALPAALWFSTGLLAALSGVMHVMLGAVRRDQVALLRRAVAAALPLALGFLICQAMCWRELLTETYPPALWRVAGFFYFFSILHALHIIGGFVPLLFVTRNTFRGDYNRHRCRGVHYCVMYWHFLGVVWFVMFCAIMIPS